MGDVSQMTLWKKFLNMTAGNRHSEPAMLVVRMPENFGRAIAPGDSKPLLDRRELRAQQTVVVDCSDCRYIDTNGIGVLVELRNEALNRGANLVLAEPTARLRNVIEITRLHRVFAIYDSLDEAVASWAQRSPSEACVPDAAA